MFAGALLIGLILHILIIRVPNFYEDETFYATIPLRVLNGESLIQHEWHLSQFSSLFLYLPVRFWVMLKGSTEGIVLFLRCLYLSIHTVTAVGIYAYFRKYRYWAVAAAILFYTQTHYRLLAISYGSMYVLFLLLMTLLLHTIYRKQSVLLYICAGICFGACCVCDPFLCIAYILYIMGCILWKKREAFLKMIYGLKRKSAEGYNKKRTLKSDKDIIAKMSSGLSYGETYSCFFSWKAILLFSGGIFVAALISLIYFFAAGGSIGSLADNIGNLLGASEFTAINSPILDKLKNTFTAYSIISFNMPFLLPVLYIAICADKKRKKVSHRRTYLIASLLMAIFYFCGISIYSPMYTTSLAITLPFMIIATVCYMLTEKKNKEMFYCICCPCFIGTVFFHLASNALLLSTFSVLSIINIPGVFFVYDLYKELHADIKLNKKLYDEKNRKNLFSCCRIVMIVGLTLQIALQLYVHLYGRLPEKASAYVESGPYAGFYMNDQYYNNYTKAINDLDIIKERSKEDAPVLIVSYHNWMYLYIDRPFAVQTTWQGEFDHEGLKRYFEVNPDRRPEYIYVDFIDYSHKYNRYSAEEKTRFLMELFECTYEELSDGILLTVTDYKQT